MDDNNNFDITICGNLTLSHFMPVMIICPVNNLPDLFYLYVEFNNSVEIYKARKELFSKLSFKRCFMEDIVKKVKSRLDDNNYNYKSIELRLITNRVSIKYIKGE